MSMENDTQILLSAFGNLTGILSQGINPTDSVASYLSGNQQDKDLSSLANQAKNGTLPGVPKMTTQKSVFRQVLEETGDPVMADMVARQEIAQTKMADALNSMKAQDASSGTALNLATKATLDQFPEAIYMDDKESYDLIGKTYAVSPEDIKKSIGESNISKAVRGVEGKVPVKPGYDANGVDERASADASIIEQAADTTITDIADEALGAYETETGEAQSSVVPLSEQEGTNAKDYLSSLIGASEGIFNDYNNPQMAAFKSAMMQQLGERAYNPRILNAVMKGAEHSLGHYLLLELSKESPFPKGTKTSYYDFLGSKNNQGRPMYGQYNPQNYKSTFEEIVRASRTKYTDTGPSYLTWYKGTEPKDRLGRPMVIAGLFEMDSASRLERSIAIAQAGWTGKGIVGEAQLGIMDNLFKRWQQEQITNPKQKKRSFLSFLSTIKNSPWYVD